MSNANPLECRSQYVPIHQIEHMIMQPPFTVNQLLDLKGRLAGTDVRVSGILHYAFEDVAIYHWPKSESRPEYESSIWLETGSGSLRFDDEACLSMNGKLVVVEGVLVLPDERFRGCGHMSLWPAALLARTLERV